MLGEKGLSNLVRDEVADSDDQQKYNQKIALLLGTAGSHNPVPEYRGSRTRIRLEINRARDMGLGLNCRFSRLVK